MTRNFKSRSEESVSEEERAVSSLSDAMMQLDHEDESPARLRDAAAVYVSPGLARAR